MKSDYIVVGAGLTGSTIARCLADAGREVLLLDRRPHCGGNVFDETHALSGIRIHTYGPHYFRTNSDRIWDFLARFSSFQRFEASILSKHQLEYYHWPLWQSEINKLCKDSPNFSGVPQNLEQACLGQMPRKIYELFVKEYNEKQWGIACTDLDKSLCSRFDIRSVNEPRLKPDMKYQGVPSDGYASLMANMIGGLRVELGVDYIKHKDLFQSKHVIYTGPIDEFFGCNLGKLKYRAQRRDHKYHPKANFLQPMVQINYPQHADGQHIRSIEWKWMMQAPESLRGTVITTETPYSPTESNDYEYPFPDKENGLLYQRYSSTASQLTNVTFCGRLGEYKYFDMDQAIARAMKISEHLLAG